jgi:hypothetical protein
VSGNEFPDPALLVLAPLQSPCSALVGPNESPRPPDLLSWDSSRARSRELSPPFHRHHPRASTPAGHRCPTSASEEPTSEVLFRPRGFAPPRRLSPLADSRACCIPQPVVGFAAFPTRRSGHDTVRRPPVQHRRRLPRDVIRTPRRTPLADSRAASPRPLPSCRFYGSRALLRRRVRTSRRPLLAGTRPVLPWASFPSKVLRCRAVNRVATPATALRLPLAKEDTKRPPGSVPLPTSRAPPGLATRRRMPRSARGGAGTRRIEMQASRSLRHEPKLEAPRSRAAAPRRSEESRTVPESGRTIPPGVRGARPPTHRTRRGVCSRLAPPESVRSRSSRGPFHRPHESRLSCGRRRVPRRPSWGS